MNPTPFSNQDQFTKDIAQILQQMQANQANPLPAELQAAVETARTQVAAAKTSDEATSILKTTVSAAAQKSGTVYSNQDLLNFERQVRKGE
jgi:hypothetical protein